MLPLSLVCMYVCSLYFNKYQQSNWYVCILMRIFVMLIQGDRLLSESAKGDEVAVERLLTEMPSLANYKDSVRIIDSSLHDETYRHHIFT